MKTNFFLSLAAGLLLAATLGACSDDSVSEAKVDDVKTYTEGEHDGRLLGEWSLANSRPMDGASLVVTYLYLEADGNGTCVSDGTTYKVLWTTLGGRLYIRAGDGSYRAFPFSFNADGTQLTIGYAVFQR